ncbi:magnesium-translocating P-type ATPase [Streptomyces mashuensis]|uniref:Magnesium-transporting ATPase, P-type 1 n=1 Tax=Streptomyces mashuensis TaxID=33904 RepID=A0A919AVZ4_9ACTN|nr:magnesium-translocating P-type ATPase [Streptomyces mashuensis]GHF25773.1 magnesium-translocating P-type ATPase [Streptomyces mashuensis]
MAESTTAVGPHVAAPAIPAGRGPGGRGPGAGKDPGPDTGSGPDLASATALQVLRTLDSGPRGLTDEAAEERLARFGENTPPDWRPPSWPRRVLRGLRDPFTAVLLGLGLVSAAVASWGTAGVIIFLVMVSCALCSLGEHRADRAVSRLRDLIATTATVLRRSGEDGPPVPREVPVDQLVPGDVVLLGPGEPVPADVRLLRATGLHVHQAALTGESAPVPKHPVDAPGPADGAPYLRPHLCFQGTSVTAGSGTAVVTATGARTHLATAHAGRHRRGPGAFQTSVRGVSLILVRFMLLTPPLVLMANAALRGRGLETLPFAMAVAVALTPEMLPVVVTTCLARGASLLARRHGVIVKRLPALHDLGAMEVLCLDKTGTLTQDRPVVDRALDAAGRDDPEVLGLAAVNAWWTLHLADLPLPDSLDEAILDAADEEEALRYEGVAALPFDPVRRLTTAVVLAPGRLGTHLLVVKGAVEAVLDRCALADGERERLHALADREAARGVRLLAIATAERRARLRDWTPADERGLTFRGFVTLRDAVTDTAADALRVLADRGVTVKVLTGDHPGTAARACHDLGLDVGGMLTADRVDAMSDEELAVAVRDTTVFARCTPEHKARIVAALRATGRTTGFLGDGANDLPALGAADVGICPRDAVHVARESADVVLGGPAGPDGPHSPGPKDLTGIGHALSAGRHASGNIAAYLRVTLSSNVGNVIAMLAVGVLLPFLPMLPAQVLVQNLCFDAAQLAFAYSPARRAAERRPAVLRPRDLLRFITGFGLLNAVADLATFGVLVGSFCGPGGWDDELVFHSGWFTENLLTQALVMVVLHTGRRTAEGTAGGGGRGVGPVGWAAGALAVAGLLLPLSPLGAALGMSALPVVYYLELAAVLSLYALALVTVRKRYERRMAAREA